MIGSLLRALIARVAGPECAYPEAAIASIDGRISDYFPL